MGFSRFVEELETERRELTVLNRAERGPVYDLLEKTFARGQDNVVVREAETPSGRPKNAVTCSDGDRTLAASDLAAVRDAVLLVNSDVYTTGTRPLGAIATPEVLVEMAETRLFAEGYPDPKKQKVLLVEMSRYIEQRAWRVGDGELHSAFQTLSRIDDESGTREAYERLADTDLDVHVYGAPDWEPTMDVVAHGHEDPALRRAWFVAYQSPRDPERSIALVAIDVGQNRWEAFWTHRPELVSAVVAHARERYPPRLTA
jgi:hypothetical protein